VKGKTEKVETRGSNPELKQNCSDHRRNFRRTDFRCVFSGALSSARAPNGQKNARP
jgi:hypothetical protein